MTKDERRKTKDERRIASHRADTPLRRHRSHRPRPRSVGSLGIGPPRSEHGARTTAPGSRSGPVRWSSGAARFTGARRRHRRPRPGVPAPIGHSSSLPECAGRSTTPPGSHPTHPLVARLAHDHPRIRIPRSEQVVDSLIRAVFGQKVTGKEAKTAYARMVRAQGEPAPGPRDGLFMPPDPGWLGARDYSEFHPWGVERRRAEDRDGGRPSQQCAWRRPSTMPLPYAYRRSPGDPGRGAVVGGVGRAPGPRRRRTPSWSATSTSRTPWPGRSPANREATTTACSNCSSRSVPTAGRVVRLLKAAGDEGSEVRAAAVRSGRSADI